MMKSNIELLALLTVRERKTLQMWLGLNGDPPMTTKEMSDHFMLTTTRIRQIRDGGLKKIGAHMLGIELTKPERQNARTLEGRLGWKRKDVDDV